MQNEKQDILRMFESFQVTRKEDETRGNHAISKNDDMLIS